MQKSKEKINKKEKTSLNLDISGKEGKLFRYRVGENLLNPKRESRLGGLMEETMCQRWVWNTKYLSHCDNQEQQIGKELRW